MTLRIFSYGGGVQSTAALVLAAQGKIDFQRFWFSNVGEDSENPDTLAYVRDYAQPFAEEHRLEFRTLQRTITRGPRKGEQETIYSRVMRSRSQVIPGYLGQTGAPGRRSCTADFKIRVISQAQRALGATADDPAVTGLGISVDEFQRMKTDSGIPHQVLEYPLIALRLTRTDCKRIIKDAGLPIPPKSACYFCPYQSVNSWRALKEHRPELFQRAVRLEQRMLEMAALRNDAIYLSRNLIPLEQALSGTQNELFGDDFDESCESGFCMT